MDALKKRNPLTESFLIQLDLDFEALAAKIPALRDAFPRGPTSDEDQVCVQSLIEQGQATDIYPQATVARIHAMEHGAAPGDGVCAPGKKPYRNDCLFLKTAGDSGNVAEGPNIVDSASDHRGPAESVGTNGNRGHGMGLNTNWMDDPNLNLTAQSTNFGTVRQPAQDVGGGSQNNSATTATSENQDTPNSSTNSGAEVDSRSRTLPRAQSSASRNSSFPNNPFSPHPQPSALHGLMQVGGMELSSNGGNSFFGDTSNFLQGNHQGEFDISGGWGAQDLQGQMGMDGTSSDQNGMLRVLMGMGGIDDSMDLGSWNNGADENHMG